MVKNLPAVQELQEAWVQSQVRKVPWRRVWQPTPVFLRGEPPWTEEPGGLQSMGCRESDTTKWLIVEDLKEIPRIALK